MMGWSLDIVGVVLYIVIESNFYWDVNLWFFLCRYLFYYKVIVLFFRVVYLLFYCFISYFSRSYFEYIVNKKFFSFFVVFEYMRKRGR